MPTSLRRVPLFACLAALVLSSFVALGCKPTSAQAPPAGGFLFCFWNVENLFDDRDDQRHGADKEYDHWFAHNDEDRQLKYDHLAEALLKMNDGKGPDILALAEVESLRAAEILQQTLNGRIKDESLHYRHVLMKEVDAGRHIAPAILTRLPVEANRTRLRGNRQRILEGHIAVNGHDLILIASHWTSRVSDNTGDHRAKYGDVIYGAFRGMYKSNPDVALLVCGDFNDTPEQPSVVRHLHGVGDREQVLASTENDPYLLDLMAGKDADAGFGTHNYRGKWFIFDQIAVSPAMLAGPGWTVVPDSIKTINTLTRPTDRQRRPWRFGNPKEKFDRGYSDHFPVTARLQVPE